MKRYDYRTKINDEKDSDDPPKAPLCQEPLRQFLNTHKKVVIKSRYDYFFHSLLPQLKEFTLCNAGLLEIDEKDFFIVAKITCEIIHILEEEPDFTRVLNFANLKTITVSDDGLPVLELYFRCYEYISM